MGHRERTWARRRNGGHRSITSGNTIRCLLPNCRSRAASSRKLFRTVPKPTQSCVTTAEYFWTSGGRVTQCRRSICEKRERARAGVLLTHFTCVGRRHSVDFQRRFPQPKTKGFCPKSPRRSELGGEQEDAGARSSDAPTSMAVNPAASMPSGLGGPPLPAPPPPASTPLVSTLPAAHVPAPPAPPPPQPLSHYAVS